VPVHQRVSLPGRLPGDRCPRHLRATCPPPCPTGCTGHASTCPQRHDGGIHYESPKTQRGRRVVSLPGPLVEALRVHRRQQREDKMAARNKWVERDLVFAGPFGEPVDARRDWRDWRDWRDLLAEAGVEPTKVHTARHTAATLLLVMGVDPRTVMDIMGWSQQAMLTRYQHVVDELRQEAAKRMGEKLWGPALLPDSLPRADVEKSS
jgi:integrase